MNECKASCGGGNAPARSLITPVKIASTFLAAAVLAVATPGSVLAAASSNEGGEYAYAGSPSPPPHLRRRNPRGPFEARCALWTPPY